MKKRIYSIIHFLLAVAIAVTISACQQSGGGGIEITNGNCVGTIYNPDHSKAVGAVVYIVHVNSNPSEKMGVVDSTLTDADGQYSLQVKKSDLYNIIATKGDAACLLDSISVKTTEETVADGILAKSGELSGIITVKEGDDPRLAIILIRGTNLYTSPSDSTGNFIFPILPEGHFRVQVLFTGESDYTMVDTIIEIRKGTATKLNLILSSNDAPVVNGLTMIYDDATMYATVSWQPLDTIQIESYAVYRKSKMGNDTMIRVEKSSNTLIDDIVTLEGDTIHYEIAAIGKTFREGNRSSTQNVAIKSRIIFEKEITLPPYDLFADNSLTSFMIDNDNNFIISRTNPTFDSSMVNSTVIDKINKDGILMKSIELNYPSQRDGSYERARIQNDQKGNLYFQIINKCYPTICTIKKFDADLNFLKELRVEAPTEVKVTSWVVSDNGKLYLFTDKHYLIDNEFNTQPVPHEILVYSNDFEPLDTCSAIFPYEMKNITMESGFFVRQFSYRRAGVRTYSWIDYWDTSFSLKKSVYFMDTIQKYVPPSLQLDNRLDGDICIPVPNVYSTYARNLSFEMRIQRPVLIIGSQNTPLLARRLVEPSNSNGFRLFVNCDNMGNFYELVFDDQFDCKIYKYSMSGINSFEGGK